MVGAVAMIASKVKKTAEKNADTQSDSAVLVEVVDEVVTDSVADRFRILNIRRSSRLIQLMYVRHPVLNT